MFPDAHLRPQNLTYRYRDDWVSLVAQMVKNLSAMQETWVQALAREDSLEKEMATHSTILAWRIPWTEELGELQYLGLKRPDMTGRLSTHTEMTAPPCSPAWPEHLNGSLCQIGIGC